MTPPYNTGKEFIYHDDYHDSIENYLKFTSQANTYKANADTSGRFHTKWLNEIYPALLLARELLSDDGVIFISIDDNEYSNLKNICDEIYGEQNFRNTLMVRRRIKSLNAQFADNGLVSLNVGVEYVLVYSKSSRFAMKALRCVKEVPQIEGRWQGFWSNADRPTMRYDILGFTPAVGQWRTSKEKADIAVANYQKYLNEYSGAMSLEDYSEKTGITNFIKRDPNGRGQNGGVYHWVAPSDSTLRTSNWTDIEVSQIIKEIDLPFDNPKNRQLIAELIKLSEFSKTDIILDFFSGSATTAHAVMKLNAEDGGNRRFIMVQLPEPCKGESEAYKAGYKNICEIGKERIRRAGEKVKAEAGDKAKDLDIGFRVFKLDRSNVIPWNTDSGQFLDQLEQQEEVGNLRPERSSDDLFFEVLLKQGIELTVSTEIREIEEHQVYSLGYGQFYCCFDARIGDEAQALAAGIARWHEEQDPEGRNCVVYVRDSAFDGKKLTSLDSEADARKMSFCTTLEQSGIMQVKAF